MDNSQEKVSDCEILHNSHSLSVESLGGKNACSGHSSHGLDNHSGPVHHKLHSINSLG